MKAQFDKTVFRRDLLKLIARCERTINDCELRAQHRPDQPTIDTERFKTMLAKAQACLAALDAGDSAAFAAAMTAFAEAKEEPPCHPQPVSRQGEP